MLKKSHIVAKNFIKKLKYDPLFVRGKKISKWNYFESKEDVRHVSCGCFCRQIGTSKFKDALCYYIDTVFFCCVLGNCQSLLMVFL